VGRINTHPLPLPSLIWFVSINQHLMDKYTNSNLGVRAGDGSLDERNTKVKNLMPEYKKNINRNFSY
jgi:hypothetical protein